MAWLLGVSVEVEAGSAMEKYRKYRPGRRASLSALSMIVFASRCWSQRLISGKTFLRKRINQEHPRYPGSDRLQTRFGKGKLIAGTLPLSSGVPMDLVVMHVAEGDEILD